MITTTAYKALLGNLSETFSHPRARQSIARHGDRLAFTVGNLKIGPDTLIFNMGSATDCPSAKMGLCKLAHKKHGGNGKCYALKAEAMYPASLAFRSIQAIQWEHFTAAQIADAIFTEVSKSQKRAMPIRYVRLNESGDFYSFSCVLKAGRIAGYVMALCKLAGIPVVKFYTYSHRSDIFAGIGGQALLKSLPANLTINGSNFKAHNEFRVLNITRPERDAKGLDGTKVNPYTCKDDCSICSLCKGRNQAGITIIQSMH